MTSAVVGRRSVPSIPNWVLGTAGVAILFLLLEAVPRAGIVDARYLPPISEMLAALWSALSTGAFWSALGATMLTWGIGLAIALVAGIVLGVVIGSSAFLREFTASTIEFLRPVPSVALIPVSVLLLGTGMASTLLLVVYASFWQVLIQVLAGVRDVDPVASDTARSYRFRRMTQVRTVVWPTTLPYAMTGLRLAASVALILTVTGELLISFDGIGGLFETARQSGDVSGMYAYVIVTGILGLLVNVLARLAEQRMLFWHPSVRGEALS